MEALDNAIAELFYAENLPDELAPGGVAARLHKLQRCTVGASCIRATKAASA